MRRRGYVLALLWGLSWGLWAEDGRSISGDLDELERLMLDIQASNERQQKLSEDLAEQLKSREEELTISRQTIQDLWSISEAQGSYLNALRRNAGEQQEIYSRQSGYLVELKTKRDAWRLTCLIAVPVAAGLGFLVGWLSRR